MLPPQTETTRQWAARVTAALPALRVVVAEDEAQAAREISQAEAAFGTISPALLRQVCDRICRKIDWTEQVPPADTALFLRDFYTAQRRYLEREQLFGRPRADKFQGTGFKGSGEPGSRA